MRYLATLLMVAVFTSATPATSQDLEPVVYVGEFEVKWDRLDSLRTLISRYSIPWQEFVASQVDGYQRWYFTHDTGDEANYYRVTQYPDWDYVRGDEIDYSALWNEYKAANGITDEEDKRRREAFAYVFEGSTHTDRILRPITAEQE